MAALNHMDIDISLSTELLILMGTGFGVSVICLILAGIGLSKIPAKGDYPILQGIAVCTILMSLFSGVILA